MEYDFLVVGAGLFGCTFAQSAVKGGYRVLLIDQREHIAGAAYDEMIDGVPVCKYGQHVFHTNSKRVWDYVNSIVPFDPYRLKIVSRVANRVFSFPINMMTLHQLWGVTTPEEAIQHLARVQVRQADQRNAEGWLLSHLGEELTETFYRGYSEKQWHRPLNEIPAYIVRRIPVRTDWNDAFFNDTYEGMPRGGYTNMCQAMLDGVKVVLDTDYFSRQWSARHTVFTGPLDRFFDYRYGKLTYNTLKFEHFPAATGSQGIAVINYPGKDVPWLRSVEHGCFYQQCRKRTVISRDYPTTCEDGQNPFYPIRDLVNSSIYEKYASAAMAITSVTFGGRLGAYRYFNMDQTVMAAKRAYHKVIGGAEVSDGADDWRESAVCQFDLH